MVYQAKRDEQVDTLNKVLNDEVEAEKAIEDFETASPIDWVRFMKKHGVRRSFVKRTPCGPHRRKSQYGICGEFRTC